MLKLNKLLVQFGGLKAVNQLSLKVPKGIIFGLIGPNGAGKTTVFKAINGVYKPTSGKIFFNNQEITGMQPWEVNYLGISRTDQGVNVFRNITVIENVMIGCQSKSNANFMDAIFHTYRHKREEKEIFEKSMEILNFLGIASKKDFLAKNLSYGEQRLLEIGRAMASEPELLLLDEPAAGMNSKEKVILMEIIKSIYGKGVTIVLVEHNMKFIMDITHTICVLNYGECIAIGEPAYIRNHPNVIKAYLGGE
jgi:branched-chain amino acid transport system ATP-binding protein